MDLKGQLASLMPGNCDKCDLPVPLDNNLVALMFVRSGNPVAALNRFRHLLPVVEHGKTVCEGSPSRAQYLEGQPRDKRGQFPYEESQVVPTKRAYAELQRIARQLQGK